MNNVARVLGMLTSHSNEMFNELQGFNVITDLAALELDLIADEVECSYIYGGAPLMRDKQQYIKSLVRLVKISL